MIRLFLTGSSSLFVFFQTGEFLVHGPSVGRLHVSGVDALRPTGPVDRPTTDTGHENIGTLACPSLPRICGCDCAVVGVSGRGHGVGLDSPGASDRANRAALVLVSSLSDDAAMQSPRNPILLPTLT